MNNNDTGLLLNAEDIKLYREWFKEMCSLIGIKVRYRYPLPNTKTYSLYGELDTCYSEEIKDVGIIFEEHPTERTMKKLGWTSEVDEGMSIIHVPYDLIGIQSGCLVKIPAGLDNAEPRTFRIVKLSNIAVYPASIACEIAPEFKDTFEKASTEDFSNTNFNLIKEEED